jgi:hypothetical protein
MKPERLIRRPRWWQSWKGSEARVLLRISAANTESARVCTIAGGTSFWKLEAGPWLLGMAPIPSMPPRPGFLNWKGYRETGRPDRDFKKNFSVRPEVDSLACWLKDSGYSVTAICTALGWPRATFYRRLRAGQGAGSPALKWLGSRDPVGDAQLLASIKEIKQNHPFWGYRRVRAWLKYREGLPMILSGFTG